MKVKEFIKNPRMIILVLLIILSVFFINPSFSDKGLAIRSVAKDSSAAMAGFESPGPKISPTSKERIISINGLPVNTLADYEKVVSDLTVNETVLIRTSKSKIPYELTTIENVKLTYLDEYENISVSEEVFNNATNETETITKIVERQKVLHEVLPGVDLGLRVYDAPKNNVRLGLDLSGGTRVLLEPETKLSEEDSDLIVENLKKRLNVFGLTDIVVKIARDLDGNAFILIEVAGINEEEVRELVSKQGKFEARVANETVFVGGTDITYVCKTADCSRIEACQNTGDGFFCRFSFSISLSPEAAQRHADVTAKQEVVTSEHGTQYLKDKLELYLDDEKVDELNIGADLKGKAIADIAISGSGSGDTRKAAQEDAGLNMKKLQTVLITGSLPVKLDIVKVDTITSNLGKRFLNNSILIGLVAILIVASIVTFRYRQFKIALPIVLTMLSEVVIILGVASYIGWNIDLAAIAGIIIAVGTGVDDQIVITDELLNKRRISENAKKNIKRAFFIIMAAFTTTVFAMIPLLFAGAGLLKGFALTTIIGVAIGVFVTRPAFGVMLRFMLNK